MLSIKEEKSSTHSFSSKGASTLKCKEIDLDPQIPEKGGGKSMFNNINRCHSLFNSILLSHSRALPAVPDVE
jgi:hypothetical protein